MNDHSHSRRQTVSRNIESIIKLEEEDERRLSSLHRGSHKIGWFVGTIYFIISQVAFVIFWVLWNAYAASPFDPYHASLFSLSVAYRSKRSLLTSYSC